MNHKAEPKRGTVRVLPGLRLRAHEVGACQECGERVESVGFGWFHATA